MEYNFKRFTSVGGKFVVKVTIAKPGGLSFSSGFYSKYDTQKYKSIFVFYDEGNKTIAIKFLKEIKEGSFKLKARKENKGGYASAISFIKSYGLDKYFGERITPEIYNDSELGELFLLKLDD